MAVLIKNDQQLYKGRGPIDSKSLVKTYAELLDINAWTKEDTLIAYNGMITAVWLNKEDTSKNGIYFLFDPAVTTAIKKPDVTNEANWHKLADISDVADFTNRLAALDARLTALEEDSDIITYGYRELFPAEGKANKLYVAADEGKTYVWFNDDYLLVSSGDSYEEPTVIHGGSAD